MDNVIMICECLWTILLWCVSVFIAGSPYSVVLIGISCCNYYIVTNTTYINIAIFGLLYIMCVKV